jgi:NodT family efflux transporter outer membrane factor (OMF) lipoprotein
VNPLAGPTTLRSIGTLLLMAVLAQACVAIPEHDAAPMPTPESFHLEPDFKDALATPAFKSGNWQQADWWRQFGDAQLNRLMDKALAENPDIRIAAARVRLAQQMAAFVHAGNQPQVAADASVTRERFSKNYIFPPYIAADPQIQGQIALNASLDLDFWGRNRDLYRARLSDAQAAAADQAETRLVISAALAQAYFHLQGSQARRAVAHAALLQREDFARLVRLRADNGLENLVAVKQAEADVARERANLVALERDIEAGKRMLAALTGGGPNDTSDLLAVTPIPDAALPLPAMLPMDLLARRPDVTAARWRVEAAARQVGVAKAGFYPNINLIADVGVQSLGLSQLLTPESIFSTFGPAIHLPIFGGGSLRANLGARYAEYDIAVEQYHRALVNAAHNVADQLAAVRSLDQEQTHQAQALRDSEEAFRIARLRYQKGVSDYLVVLQVERDLLQQRDINTQLDEARRQAVLALIKALGGGYIASELPPAQASLRR